MDKLNEYADIAWSWLNCKIPAWAVIIIAIIIWFVQWNKENSLTSRNYLEFLTTPTNYVKIFPKIIEFSDVST